MFNYSDDLIRDFAQKIVNTTRLIKSLVGDIDEWKIHIFDRAKGGLVVDGGMLIYNAGHHRKITDLNALSRILKDECGLSEQQVQDSFERAKREVFVDPSISVKLD